MRARRPVSAQRAPSTAQPPIASTSSNRASNRKLRRLRLMAARVRRAPAGDIGRDDDSASSFRRIRAIYAGTMPGHWELVAARARPVAALRGEAAAADRASARTRRPRAEGQRAATIDPREDVRKAMEAPEDEARAAGSDRPRRAAASSRPARPAASRSARPSRSRRSSSSRIVIDCALGLEDRDQLGQPGAGRPDVLQPIFLEELHVRRRRQIRRSHV